ncbi:hypothetical protein GCM10010988_21110 [Cnuibacter physcomitrellae]|uniref:Uncharacterized protein n=1 Tax=Cnuibacter physcomitrellae TaxID=1619308 RepID=A0A1X9LQR9_9MICO|nr:hypothetical protein [Cnuibacter physcomitrellae]ARJ06792.1 hypothetical protein B5808_17370 [Cnuibacter physcomitrellae]GGI38846.1 hypothetical protein GCM10010988_21110 [Cnuibacter physcomitrellae]
MTQATPTGEQAAVQVLREQVKELERAVLVFPVLLIEALLAFSLILPFLTDTVDGEDETVNLFTFTGALLGPGSDGETDGVDMLFGIAYLVLIAVIIGTMIAVAVSLQRETSRAGRVTFAAFAGLLIAGTAGAWLTLAPTLGEYNPPTVEVALPLLSLATVLTAVYAFLPILRRIRER